MKFKTLFYLALAVLLTASCDEDKIVDFDIPDDSDKLVVFGFLSPGDTITSVYVSYLKPIVGVGKDRKKIDYAVVKITHNGKEHLLKYDTLRNQYIISDKELAIKGGDTYSLKVSAKGYKTASSTIKVIGEENRTLKFEKFIKKYKDYEYQLSIAVKWQDNADFHNYYMLRMHKTTTDNDAENEHYYDDYYYNKKDIVLYNDANWNGQKKYSRDLSMRYSDSKMNIAIALVNADEHYYKYHKKALEQDEFFDNPFAEPVITYSNIENGVGVFCSYTKHIIDVEWKGKKKQKEPYLNIPR